jgi:hypothetical protein
LLAEVALPQNFPTWAVVNFPHDLVVIRDERALWFGNDWAQAVSLARTNRRRCI